MVAGARDTGPLGLGGVSASTRESVVRIQPLLLCRCETPIGVDPWCVLDLVLVVGDTDVTTIRGRVPQWDEALRHAEEAGLHGHEARLATRVVDIDLTDTADLLTVGTDHVASR